MKIKFSRELDIMLKFFAVHERGVNDYIRDMWIYYHSEVLKQKFEVHPEFVPHPMFELQWTAVYNKLKEDGYFYEKPIINGQILAIGWTFEGRMKYDQSFLGLFYRHRPYTLQEFRRRLQIALNIAKILAIVANAIAILWLTWKASQLS